MGWLREFRRRFSVLLFRERFDRELEEEMRFHLEMQTEEHREEGMESREAGYAAMRQFGNMTLLKEASRETWNWRWLEALSRDIRLAFRLMVRSPVFTLVAVFTLALGLGANLAIFAMLYDVVLRPVRYQNADRLMDVHLILAEQRRRTIPMSWSYPKFEEVRQWNQSFEALAAFRARNFTLVGIDRPERLKGEIVTAPYFRIIGVGAAMFVLLIACLNLASLLYGVTANDPLTFALAVAVLIAAAMAASYVPARRATKIDPLKALRHE